jgi:hypothetical protein
MFTELPTDVECSSYMIPSSKYCEFLLLSHFQTTISVKASLPIEGFVIIIIISVMELGHLLTRSDLT